MRLRAALASGAAGAVIMLLAGGATQATAAPCDQSFVGGGPSAWELDASDGEFGDGYLLTEIGFDVFREDAFDDYGVAEIDDVAYENPDEQGCRVPRGRQEILYPADLVNDVRVKPQLYVSKRKPFARQFVSLRNTTDGPLTVDFGWDGDIGSDSGTTAARTSSGDQLMTAADRWATTCEDYDDDGCANVVDEADRDPELAHNWEGRGSKRHSADFVVDAVAEDGDFDIRFDDVTIGAGRTVTFLQVVTMAPTIKAANRAVATVDRNPARYGAFAKLSKRELRGLQNWKKPRLRRGGR